MNNYGSYLGGYNRDRHYRLPKHTEARAYTVDEPLAVHVFDNKVIIVARNGEVTEVPR